MSKKKQTRNKKYTSSKTSSKSKASSNKKVVVADVEEMPKEQVRAAAPVNPKKKADDPSLSELPFTRMNYILLGIGVAIIAIGFWLMSLDPFIDATEFSISLYIAPIVVVGGFVEIIFAIMYKEPGTIVANDDSGLENI